MRWPNALPDGGIRRAPRSLEAIVTAGNARTRRQLLAVGAWLPASWITLLQDQGRPRITSARLWALVLSAL